MAKLGLAHNIDAFFGPLISQEDKNNQGISYMLQELNLSIYMYVIGTESLDIHVDRESIKKLTMNQVKKIACSYSSDGPNLVNLYRDTENN